MAGRRAWLRTTAGAGVALGLNPGLLEALQQLRSEPLLQRAIPKTGELLPVIGLGGANRPGFAPSDTSLSGPRWDLAQTPAPA